MPPGRHGFRGVGQLRILLDVDDATEKVVSIRTHIAWQEQARQIWMDGRPHPSALAPHTWQGFSTGEWDGDTLTVTTTHLKAAWIRRNGLIISDEATMMDYFTLHENGTLLTHITLLNDDNYLTEPLIRSQHFRRTRVNRITPYPCDAVVEVIRAEGVVPHYLPGQNAYLQEFAEKYGLPLEAARGGAETLYPEYFFKLKSLLSELFAGSCSGPLRHPFGCTAGQPLPSVCCTPGTMVLVPSRERSSAASWCLAWGTARHLRTQPMAMSSTPPGCWPSGVRPARHRIRSL